MKVFEPMYVVGDMCMNNSSQVDASAGTLTVTGGLSMNSSVGIGASGTPLPNLHTGSGCRTGSSGAYAFPCTTAQKVYVTTQDQTVGSVSKPPIDLAYWYTNAKPGPSTNCTSGSFPGGFDNDSVLNRSRADVNLFVSTYDCTVTVSGSTVGRIAYTGTALTIQGTIFFDGNIVMAGSQKIPYTGRGTIYASGTVNLQG